MLECHHDPTLTQCSIIVHLPLTTDGVFSRLRVEKEGSSVAVVMGKVASTCSRMGSIGLDTGMHCMLCMHPVQPMTKDKKITGQK